MEQFEGMEMLSPGELTALQQLESVNPDTIWGKAINNVVKNPDVMRFRRLVCSLKQQDADNPEVMQNILGNAYQSIINL